MATGAGPTPAPPLNALLGDPAAVGDHRQDVGHDEDADAPREGDPDVGADQLVRQQVAYRVDEVLDPNVVVRIDGGQNAPRPFARPPLVGAEAVARATKGLQDGAIQVEAAIVNGAAGVIVRFPARSLVAAFTVTNGLILEIDIVADPDKLRGLYLD
jgi:hypothetical protein